MIADLSLAYAHANRSRFVVELKEFVRFPSISAQPERADDSRRCAEWLANHLRSIGLEHVEVIPTRGNPLVYADWLHAPDRPTVLIYGHYDVQPAEPLDQWQSPPFEPVVRGNDLYGRGASDDKGQLLAHIKALESFLRSSGRLPINVKCLFEGEEEIGRPNFVAFLTENHKLLAADVALISDTAMAGRGRPAITYSMRGSLSLELEVAGGETDLHDGLFGGAVHNPVKGLCDIVARLQTSDGEIAIPGFYDDVHQLNEKEREFMAASGRSDRQILSDARVERGWGERAYTLYERTTTRPSLSSTGIAGGYQGQGPKGIIPAKALAKLNFRLVPDQDPLQINKLVRRHITRLAPYGLRVTTRTHVAAKPVLTDRQHPFVRAAVTACRKVFGVNPLFIRSGGTIPAVAAFQQILGQPTVLMGLGLPTDRIHAPNERFHLPNFHKGIAVSICFLAEIGNRALA